ncbi:SRPBCC family protein [Ahrensia marina]|uniref:SRPBCC family protein n=1 Tax=Ahrensia marina TaxID=1514904 RepID=UPI0035CF26F5
MEDQITRTIELKAPIERVWKALTDHDEFGSWFRLSLHGPFKVGELTLGVTEYPGHEGLPFWARVVAMDEPRLFSFIWPMDESIRPDDPELDHKTTRVEFTLEPTASGTKLTVRETGFESLPENRRLQAFRDNQGGWDQQTANIKKFVE